jgi:hypothetical protein
VPPVTGDEYKYFENNEVMNYYEAELVNKTSQCNPRVGEPTLLFHEFVFLLSRIALTLVTTEGNIRGKLRDFFVQKLGFTPVLDLEQANITFEDVTRKLRGTLGSDDEEGFDSEEGEEEWSDDEFEMDENQRKLMEFLAKKAQEEKDFIIDYDSIIQDLDSILPQIPGRPEVEQINPPPYKLPRILFGKLMPKKDDEDGGKKKKKAPKKAPARKKDEPPPKPVKWAPPPGAPEPVTLDLVRKAKQDLMENIFPNNIRGE